MELNKEIWIHQNSTILEIWHNFVDHCYDVFVFDHSGGFSILEIMNNELLDSYRASYKSTILKFDDDEGYVEFMLRWS